MKQRYILLYCVLPVIKTIYEFAHIMLYALKFIKYYIYEIYSVCA